MAASTVYIPKIIYDNLFKMLQYRKLVTNTQVLDRESLMMQLNTNGYVRIDAKSLNFTGIKRVGKAEATKTEATKTEATKVSVVNNAEDEIDDTEDEIDDTEDSKMEAPVRAKTVAEEIAGENTNILDTIEPTAKRNREISMAVILIAQGSKYATRSADFRNIVTSTLSKGDLNSIIIVSEDEITRHIGKVISGFRKEFEGVYVEFYDYRMFSSEKPVHKSVPKHEFATEEEVEQLYVTKENLQKILLHDPQAVWIGARVGEVIKITRISESTGKSIAYRICSR